MLRDPRKRAPLQKTVVGKEETRRSRPQRATPMPLPRPQVVVNVQRLRAAQQEEGWFRLQPDQSKSRQRGE